MPSEDERIKLYSKISAINKEVDFSECVDTVKQTYGEIPKELTNLIKIAYLKNLAIEQGVKRIQLNANVCKIYLYKKEEIMSEGLNNALYKRSNGVLKFEDVPIIEFDMGLADINNKLQFLLDFFKEAITNVKIT